LTISGTYSYGKSTVLLDATSSQNSSQWNTESVNGSNALALSRSDFDQGRRIISNGNATLKWNKFTKTRIGVFYETKSRVMHTTVFIARYIL
jgi:hypothetical protein